ncbi:MULTISPECIES: hypothetical protein [unclassified Amycolatopsis]|uniref:hypothetical protein n=1 Tax=unclassified Amycolatopsis TaxID=2618356 RepID=UPI001FF234BB|nr:hypothetical protein [Amycolatopsis sp. FBCC-B4732]UOX92109.1 hypothetical protein MUY14_16285 [Amycolatopsis sp. FBCC-B4732]
MTEAEHQPISPDVPRPPGTPDVDLDIEIPPAEREKPEGQDVDEDAGEVEPPS